jgi:ketosteroid isomerase-like protein
MSAREVGKRLVELCKQGKNMESIETLYADDVTSIEPTELLGFARETHGKAAVIEKNIAWASANEIKSAQAEGPYPHGEERFAVIFRYDVLNKPSGRRAQFDEVALFTVVSGKIVKEEFFYDVG